MREKCGGIGQESRIRRVGSRGPDEPSTSIDHRSNRYGGGALRTGALIELERRRRRHLSVSGTRRFDWGAPVLSFLPLGQSAPEIARSSTVGVLRLSECRIRVAGLCATAAVQFLDANSGCGSRPAYRRPGLQCPQSGRSGRSGRVPSVAGVGRTESSDQNAQKLFSERTRRLAAMNISGR